MRIKKCNRVKKQKSGGGGAEPLFKTTVFMLLVTFPRFKSLRKPKSVTEPCSGVCWVLFRISDLYFRDNFLNTAKPFLAGRTPREEPPRHAPEG